MIAMPRSFRRQLIAAALIALAAGGASVFPQAFALDRSALAGGELWRLWTGHFVHTTADHFRYDVGAALLLCFALGKPLRLLLWAPCLSLVLLAVLPGLQTYYGLSALLHTWVVFGALDLALESRGVLRTLAFALVAGTLLKALLETLLGVSFFSGGLDFGGEVLRASHLVGAVFGLVLLCAERARRASHSSSSVPTSM